MCYYSNLHEHGHGKKNPRFLLLLGHNKLTSFWDGEFLEEPTGNLH